MNFAHCGGSCLSSSCLRERRGRGSWECERQSAIPHSGVPEAKSKPPFSLLTCSCSSLHSSTGWNSHFICVLNGLPAREGPSLSCQCQSKLPLARFVSEPYSTFFPHIVSNLSFLLGIRQAVFATGFYRQCLQTHLVQLAASVWSQPLKDVGKSHIWLLFLDVRRRWKAAMICLLPDIPKQHNVELFSPHRPSPTLLQAVCRNNTSRHFNIKAG